jgi:hypothetical protein
MKTYLKGVYGKGLLSVSLFTVLMTTGCTSWINQFKDNPALFVQQLQSDTNIIVAGLTATFNAIVVLLPAEKQADITKKWYASVAALNDTEAAINLAIHVAQEAGNKNPDITGMVTDIVNAVMKIQDVVNEIKTIIATTPEGQAKVQKMQTKVDQLYTMYVKSYKASK